MARTIHKIISGSTTTVALVETNGAGGGWAHPGVLSTVKIKNDQLQELFSHRVLNNPRIEEINRSTVDLRCKGPRSHFSKRLSELNEALRSELNGPALVSSSSITNAAELQEHFKQIEPAALSRATKRPKGDLSARRL